MKKIQKFKKYDEKKTELQKKILDNKTALETNKTNSRKKLKIIKLH